MKKVVVLAMALMLVLASLTAVADYAPSKDLNIRVPFASGGSAALWCGC